MTAVQTSDEALRTEQNRNFVDFEAETSGSDFGYFEARIKDNWVQTGADGGN